MVPPAHKVKPTMGLISARLLLLVKEVMLPSPSISEFTVTGQMRVGMIVIV